MSEDSYIETLPSIIDFGLDDYEVVLKKQIELFDILIEKKKRGEKTHETILIGEHFPVITLGRRAKPGNILVPEEFLIKKGIKVYNIGRGGDVTYHAPGQLIVYPLLDLEKHNLGVKNYVYLLEEAVINLVRNYNIDAGRVDNATGVWIDAGTPEERKICAIGIKCSRFCTMHGIGLNVNTNLSGFQLINPCGFQDKGVTSMEKETGKIFDIKKIKKEFLTIFTNLLSLFYYLIILTT